MPASKEVNFPGEGRPPEQPQGLKTGAMKPSPSLDAVGWVELVA